MQGYQSLSRYYDLLMEDARYSERARYILEICKCFGHDVGKVCDLCCGTGSLTRELKKLGVDIFGVDGSIDMLSEASQKGYEENINILYVNQLMQELILPCPADTVICTLDSLNHLTETADLKQTFKAVNNNLKRGGLFIFDMNTLYKHRVILGNNDFVLEAENVLCAWQNVLHDDDIVEITLDFFEKEENGLYSRCSDFITERAYSLDVIKNLLEESGFDVLGCFGDLTFEAPKDDEQRVVFAAAKK